MMYFNIFHRAETGWKFDIFRRQQDLAHEWGFKTTAFLYYSGLFDDEVAAHFNEIRTSSGDEIGLALHNLNGPDMDDITGGLRAFWLLSTDRKRRALELMIGRYREVFGVEPASMASYHFDASSLQVIREISPGTKNVIGGCFEEGVRVFHGCNHSWYLFNEGMPWAPWYPSKTHSLRPAKNAEDSAGVLAVPHLCRDMSLSFEGRNDFWASHPPNVIRGMGNDGEKCPYDLNLIDQYRLQEEINGGESYYNTFVSAEWLTWSHNSEYPPDIAWNLYRKMFAYCAELKEQGALTDMTLSAYGEHFRAAHPVDRPRAEVYWAKEMLYGSGKHYLWYIDPKRRVLIDTSQGGSIGDFRVYASEYAVSTGPDTPHRDKGTYPYVIQSQHRTGARHHCSDGARTTCKISHGGQTLDLCDMKTSCREAIRDGGEIRIVLAPVRMIFEDGFDVSIATSYLFTLEHDIRMERSVVSASGFSDDIEITEYFKGCHGITEYPEDLHGIRLNVDGDREESLEYEYGGRKIRTNNARRVAAELPMANTMIALEPADGAADVGSAREGHLFSPYFTLELTYHLKAKRKIATWIRTRKLSA